MPSIKSSPQKNHVVQIKLCTEQYDLLRRVKKETGIPYTKQVYTIISKASIMTALNRALKQHKIRLLQKINAQLCAMARYHHHTTPEDPSRTTIMIQLYALECQIRRLIQ